MYHFEYKNVAFIGLNRVARASYISDVAPQDLNALWVEDRLALDSVTCELKSIVIIAQALLKPIIYDKIDDYFNTCGRVLPVLTITGDTHPDSYCMTASRLDNGVPNRFDLTIEAFRSGPILVSLVRDPTGTTQGDWFHVEDSDPADTNSKCPDLRS